MRSHPDFHPPVKTRCCQPYAAFSGRWRGIGSCCRWPRPGSIGGPAAVGWRWRLIRDYGFLGRMTVSTGWLANVQSSLRETVRAWTSYISSIWGFTHAGSCLTVAALLALGKDGGEAMGQVAFLADFFGLGIFWRWWFMRWCLMIRSGWSRPTVGLWADCGYSFVMWRKLAGQGETAISRSFTDCRADWGCS